jgi:hypothetical protein
MVVPPPDPQRITRRDLFKEPPAKKLRDDFLGGTALEVRGKLDPMVPALRGCG